MKCFGFPLFVLLLSTGGISCGESDAPAQCSPEEWSCSQDSFELTTCKEGKIETVRCMRDFGQLCEENQCVDPWRYGSPSWPRCEEDPHATTESLIEKAIAFEEITRRLHIHPQLKWVASVDLPCMHRDCEPGETPPCEDCSQPSVPASSATWEDVAVWHTGENDGLFSALYLAAEAFRYGATRDNEALEVIKLLLRGEQDRMLITGVPGVFTRQMIPPDVTGIACPQDPGEYVPDEEKDDNQWVRVGPGGCVQTVDPVSSEWVTSSHCGLTDYAGWCWLDNVSKDEYAGHMFALGVLAKLVDDPEVQTVVRDLLGQVGHHLVDQRMQFTDWDGRVTEHGRLWAMAWDDFPGFNAAMALSFLKVAAEATGDPELFDWYQDCLLQDDGELDCIQQISETPAPYTDYLSQAGMYIGEGSCKSNSNNHSMHMTSLHNLIWYEHDPDVRALVQQSLEEEVFAPPDTPRALNSQHNAWYDFMFAAHKPLGPGSSGPALDAVEDAVCMLRQYPASKHQAAVECPPDTCVLSDCTDRHDRPLIDNARQVHERCVKLCLWWNWPYSPNGCAADPRRIRHPADYLMVYWMGRYYGFIGEDM